jgi:hypothetical protein
MNQLSGNRNLRPAVCRPASIFASLAAVFLAAMPPHAAASENGAEMYILPSYAYTAPPNSVPAPIPGLCVLAHTNLHYVNNRLAPSTDVSTYTTCSDPWTPYPTRGGLSIDYILYYWNGTAWTQCADAGVRFFAFAHDWSSFAFNNTAGWGTAPCGWGYYTADSGVSIDYLVGGIGPGWEGPLWIPSGQYEHAMPGLDVIAPL